MPKSPNYNYYYSKLLDLEYCIHKEKSKQNIIHFSDGIKYSWDDIKEIKHFDQEKLKQIHDLKKKYTSYKISEIISLLNCEEMEREGLSIIRDIFNGEIVNTN